MKSASERSAAWAGVFYPADPDQLRDEVIDHMESSGEEAPGGDVLGIVAPHAGYVYSGPVAGHAYQAIRGRRYERVIVLSPSHRVALRGVSIWPRGSFTTPLGRVPVDEEGAERLLARAKGFIHDLPAAHVQEHAVEVQIPFLQVALPPFKLIPLVLGTHDLATARNLARILFETFGTKDTLYVASSDLSHYHEYDNAVLIDRLLLRELEGQENESLARALERGETEACGAGPILTVATLSKDHCAGRCTLLDYANSGDTAGSREQVVGYASFLFTAGGES